MRYLALIFLLAYTTAARADLQVFPTRLVMSDQKRVVNLSLRHLGDKPGTYKVSAIFFRMKENGSMDPVTDPTESERSLVKHLKFSPHQITIGPNAEQVIRVMFSGPGQLVEGDHRAHLHIEPVGEEEKSDGNDSGKAKSIEMHINARLAFAVPVIFHHGKTSYKAKLQNVKLLGATDAQALASVDVKWEGNSFPYGDFFAFFTPKDGESTQIGVIKGVAAYSNPRTITFPLTEKKDKLVHGNLKIEFREPEDNGGKVIETVASRLP